MIALLVKPIMTQGNGDMLYSVISSLNEAAKLLSFIVASKVIVKTEPTEVKALATYTGVYYTFPWEPHISFVMREREPSSEFHSSLLAF